MTDELRLSGVQVADLLRDWFRAVVPEQRGFDAMAKRPVEARWQEFVKEHEAALDEALIAMSFLPRREMADVVTGWSDQMVIALISRLAARTKALREENLDRCLEGPADIDPLGPALRMVMTSDAAMPR